MNPPGDPLAQLKPIHLPLEPGWWPPAPGWWLLAAALLGALICGTLWLRRWRRARAPLVQALTELAQMQYELPQSQQLGSLNQLLRRAARLAHDDSVAALAPADWAAFLARTAPSSAELAPALWMELAESAYQPDSAAASDSHRAAARAWLQENLRC